MKTKKECSAEQEKLIAHYLGWTVVSGSGSRPTSIGDIISSRMLGECKTHVNRGNKIKFDVNVWNKIKSEANSKFKFPILFVDDGSRRLDDTWCMTDMWLSDKYLKYPFEYGKHIQFPSGDLKEIGRYNIYMVNNFGNSKKVYIINIQHLYNEFGDSIC